MFINFQSGKLLNPSSGPCRRARSRAQTAGKTRPTAPLFSSGTALPHPHRTPVVPIPRPRKPVPHPCMPISQNTPTLRLPRPHLRTRSPSPGSRNASPSRGIPSRTLANPPDSIASIDFPETKCPPSPEPHTFGEEPPTRSRTPNRTTRLCLSAAREPWRPHFPAARLLSGEARPALLRRLPRLAEQAPRLTRRSYILPEKKSTLQP